MANLEIVTFRAHLDEFYFLGLEQAVTPSSNFGTVWGNFFEASGKVNFGDYGAIVWYYKDSEQIYFVGKTVDAGTKVPDGFSLVKFPACDYFVVTHTPCDDANDGIGITQNYVGIGQTQSYRDGFQLPEGYVRFDGPDSPITQIEIENQNCDGGGKRFERWVPIKKAD
jgi:Uncharacterized protein conserved in bacteria